MGMMRRAVLYVRLSVSVEDSTSIARQEADLLALADREGWEVVRMLADDGISGRKVRANVAEALRMLCEGEADVLAVWKLDRLTRQGLSAIGDLVDTLDAAPGALFVALQDGLRSDQPSWRLVAAVLSEIARTEAENTSTRAKSAIAYRKTVTNRFTGGGTIPFGYSSMPAPEGPGRVLVVNEAEAAVVRDVAERLLERDETLTSIAKDLTERGIPTSKSDYRKSVYRGEPDEDADRGRWTVATIRSIWSGDALLGRVPLNGDVVRDADGLPVAVWEPILDLATAERLRARLAGAGGPRRRRAARLLSGVAYCAHCDRKMYVTTSGGKAVYACPAKWNGFDCPSPMIQADGLDELILEMFERGVYAHLDEWLPVTEVSAPGTDEALAEVEAAMREATAQMMEDDADVVALARRLDALKARRAELRSVESVVTERLVKTGRTIGEAIRAAETVDEQRRIVLLALDHLTVSRGSRAKYVDPARVTLFGRVD